MRKIESSNGGAILPVLGLLVLSTLLGGCRSAAPGNAGCTVVPHELIVAADGSGQYKTIQEAVMVVPAGSATSPVIIRIKPGIYKELIYVQHEKQYFHFIGEDATNTVITFDLNANLKGLDGKPIGTFRTPTLFLDADDFIAENLTFENAAGPVGQALAVTVNGDRAVFRNCRFLGWQDTIFLNRGRQYFEGCYLAGHVDFIFGAATSYFERCRIHARGNGYLTAASTPDTSRHGFVFSQCTVTGEPGAKTYLGRPWRDYSAVAWLNTTMSAVVRPEGWHNWDRPEREKTSRYAEHQSTGAGAKPEMRVKWARPLSASEAAQFTVENVLGGSDGWNPNANRPARP